MQTYNKSNVIKIFPGLFIDATAVQVDTCRLAALMVEPCMFTFLANKSSPGQGREHSDNPALRSRALVQECMQELQRLHNDIDFVPQANASVAEYCPDLFISTASPADQRDYAWICTTFQSIKTTMGLYISNFHDSGDLANESNDFARDLQFWERFCKRQPMWMYIYLLWDHGRQSQLAWNTILVPGSQTFDIGCTSDVLPTSPPRSSKVSGRKQNKKRDRDHDKDDPLLEVSHKLLQKFAASPPSASSGHSGSTASRGETAAAEAARALSDHADVLKKQLKDLDDVELPGVKQLLTNSLTTVLKKLCALTD